MKTSITIITLFFIVPFRQLGSKNKTVIAFTSNITLKY